MKQPKRLTRREKIAQAAAIEAAVIENPRHPIRLPPGTYTVSGSAADEVHRQVVKGARRRFTDLDGDA